MSRRSSERTAKQWQAHDTEDGQRSQRARVNGTIQTCLHAPAACEAQGKR